MSDKMAENMKEITSSERFRFILLVIGFIALAMISQQEEVQNDKSQQNFAQVQKTNKALLSAQSK